MTLDGAEVTAPSKGSSKNLVTLEILLSLLQARGLNDTAECLKREAGFERGSPHGSPNRKDESGISDLLAPATEEALRLRSHAASLAQSEQRRRIASLSEEMQKQGQQMSEIRDLVHRVRSAASAVNRPSLEEQEEQIKRNDHEIRELEVICSERDALGRNLRMELDRTSAEVGELRRTLEEREDEETKARIQLTRLEEEALKLSSELEAVPVATQARKIQSLLAAWHDQDGHLQVMVRQIFFDMDRDRDGRLEWNNSEIRDFVHELFHRNGILLPNWQEHVWYEMYRRADVNGSYSLELEEAMRFARSCFEAALALVLTGQSENGTDASVTGEQWARTHMAVPVARSAMTYSSGVVIDFLDFAQGFSHVITANNAHRVRMVRLIETGEHLKATMRTYRECDKDGNGRLTWNNGEIREFITACFQQHGLSSPNEEQMFAMYSQFDKDRNNALDMRECLEMVDALFRSTFIVEAAAQNGKVLASQTGGLTYAMRAQSPGGTRPKVVQAAAPGASYSIRGASLGRSQGRLDESSLAGSTVVTMGSMGRGVSPSQVLVSPRSRSQVNQLDTSQDVVVNEAGKFPMLSGVGPSIRSGNGRSQSPGMRVVNQVGYPSGTRVMPARAGSATVPVGNVHRMRSGGHSPGIPIPGIQGVTSSPRGGTTSPRGAGHRVVSPDGFPTMVMTSQGFPRTASPMTMEGIRSAGATPAISQAGSHVSGALPFVNLPMASLGKSPSSDQLQGMPAIGGGTRLRGHEWVGDDTRSAGQKSLNRLSPRTLSGYAPVLKTRGPF